MRSNLSAEFVSQKCRTLGVTQQSNILFKDLTNETKGIRQLLSQPIVRDIIVGVELIPTNPHDSG